MAELKKTLIDDPRYLGFVKRYAFDLVRFSVEVCNTIPTQQQITLFESVCPFGSRTSVASGHGTGKTNAFSIIALWHLLCFQNSNTILTAPKLKTVSDGVWKEFADKKTLILQGKQSWIAEYFEIESQKVYVKGFKLQWWCIPKSAPRGNPESLAGAHDRYLLWLVDEASGVPDANFAVITGSLTDERNRMVLASQPTRASGFFYETHHVLSKEEGGAWNALVFSSIDSQLVSDSFIIEKKQQYLPEEFDVKVLGIFSEQTTKYLVGPNAIEKCVGLEVISPDEPFGWLIPVDVGGGGYRDESVILAMKVTGDGEFGENARRAQLVSVPLCSNSQDPSDLYGEVMIEAGKRNNAITLIDAGGMGLTVCKQLEKNDFTNFKKIYWGSPNFKKEYKDRYTNQRAQSTCGWARAVQEGRFGISSDVPQAIVKKLIRQGSRLPYHWDEKGRRYIAKKEDMKKEGIPSPDVVDSCAFGFLEDAHYSLSGEEMTAPDSNKDEARKKLLAELGLE